MSKLLLTKISRWFRSPLQRTYAWQQSSNYWKLRQRQKQIKFWFQKRYFETVETIRSAREAASISTGIARIITKQGVWAVILVISLETFERLLRIAVERIFLFLPLPTIVITIGSYLSLSRLESSIYVNLLATLAQISGVFLGLYFTAISVVASTAYSQVQGDVRALVVEEKVGNQYIRYIARLGAVCTLLLAASSLGLQPGFLNLLLVTLLGVVAILGFVVLGTRTFYFFDPTRLVGYLVSDLRKTIRAATPEGFKWDDASFQSFHQQRAERLLRTYLNIVYLTTAKDDIQGSSVAELARQALTLLQYYEGHKLSIPTESRWFRPVYRQREWLTSDYWEVNMALATGTTLQPQVVPDQMWFEVQVGEIVTRTMQALIKCNDFQSIQSLSNGILQTLAKLSELLAIDEAQEFLQRLRPLVAAQARSTEIENLATEAKEQQIGLALGLTDVYGVGLVNILLGLSNRLQVTSAETFSSAIAGVAWDRKRTVYTTRLPRTVVEQLEHLHRGLQFEQLVEGRTISPRWYQEQLTALRFVSFIAITVEKLSKQLEFDFAKEAEVFLAEKRYVFAAQVIQRGLEACNKYQYHYQLVKACLERLAVLRRVMDIPWTVVTWDEHLKQVESIRERLIIVYGQVSPFLDLIPKSDYWTDFFGQAYSVLKQECYRAMSTGNEKLFEKTFPPFFLMWQLAHNRLRKQLRDHDMRNQIILSTEPLQDVLELSGYAIIYSELDNKDHWKIVRQLWDHEFTQRSEPQKLVDYLINVDNFRQSMGAYLSGDIGRTAWKQELERQLRDRNVLRDDDYFYGSSGLDTDRRHPSAIIRASTHGTDMAEEAQHVFIAVYLVQHMTNSTTELSWQVQSFRDALHREHSRQRAHKAKIYET